MINTIGLIFYLYANTTEIPQNQIAQPQKQNHEIIGKSDAKEDKIESPFLVKNEKNIVLQVPYTNQMKDIPEEQKELIRTTACGPAAIKMTLDYQGSSLTLWEIIEILPNSVYIKGKMFYNLYAGSEVFNKKSVRIKRDPATFYETLSQKHPIVLNVQNYDGITGHALVIVGIKGFNPEKNTAEALIVHDPYVEAYREFKYINPQQLEQPEGYINYIGTLDPFYII